MTIEPGQIENAARLHDIGYTLDEIAVVMGGFHRAKAWRLIGKSTQTPSCVIDGCSNVVKLRYWFNSRQTCEKHRAEGRIEDCREVKQIEVVPEGHEHCNRRRGGTVCYVKNPITPSEIKRLAEFNPRLAVEVGVGQNEDEDLVLYCIKRVRRERRLRRSRLKERRRNARDRATQEVGDFLQAPIDQATYDFTDRALQGGRL